MLTRHEPRPPAAREPAADWRAAFNRRLIVAAAILGLWAAGLEARLAYLQVYRHADLVARAARQHLRTIDAPARRGDIVDRRGHVLATSADADSIYAVPSEIADPREAVDKLCRVFGDCTGRERQALTERFSQQKSFAYVRRQISPEMSRRIADLNLEGIGFMKESRRFYPNKELAAHLLGYVGLDSVGLSGLEWAYDAQIRGKPGKVLIEADARRHAYKNRIERQPTAGFTVELTIDEYLQHVAERELRAGVLQNRAAGGTAVIMNPSTGEILAMANEPTFNPNTYRESQDSERRNRAVQDLYEPGSTFKVVTASAAIEDRVLPFDALIDTNPGQIRIGARVIREDADRNYGVLSFTDVIVKSSNIGAIRIGFRVGADRLSRFVSLFGFGRQVSPDFPGENPGIVWSPDKWTESALASVSMGYQVGVTPLQMVTAVSAVANGGVLMEPRVVRAVYRGGRRYAVQPKAVRRATSADTAAELTSIMEGVVERGTARRAQIPGYTIAGKTGTAAKLINGRYSHSDYNASFVGFVPSRDAAVAIIVVIDSPHAGAGYHGGAVSAPIFQRIAESAIRYLGVGPTINPAAPVLVARDDEGSRLPTATRVPQEAVVSLVADAPPGTMPDLRGLSARQAVRTLVKLGLIARVSGDGFVVAQDPPAGAPIDAGGACRLVLERFPRPSLGLPQP